MSSFLSQKHDKFVTEMSQVSTKYATHLYTKSTTGAIDKIDYLAKGGAQKKGTSLSTDIPLLYNTKKLNDSKIQIKSGTWYYRLIYM
jgi:hypothetical protein